MMGSAPPRAIDFGKNIQRILKMYKGKKLPTRFSIFLFWKNISRKFGFRGAIGGVQTPRSAISADVIFWCHMRHLMSYASFDVICAYDIKIWQWPIWLIWVSKEASGPQQSHLCIQFLQKNCFIIKKWKTCRQFFPFIHF